MAVGSAAKWPLEAVGPLPSLSARPMTICVLEGCGSARSSFGYRPSAMRLVLLARHVALRPASANEDVDYAIGVTRHQVGRLGGEGDGEAVR